jgi:hypothetical protein
MEYGVVFVHCTVIVVVELMFAAMVDGLDPKFNVAALTLQFVITVPVTVKEYCLVLAPTGQLPADDREPYCSVLLALEAMLSVYEPGFTLC